MEKTIIIDGKPIEFKSTGATALRYKAQFGNDYLADILKLSPLTKLDMDNLTDEDLKLIDFEVFYNIAWTLAKTANKGIPDPLSWLDEFDEFPLFDILPDIQDMLLANIQQTKKK